MKQRILLAALSAVIAVGLFGCNGSNSTTGFSGMEVALSGQYVVLSKDPGILPNFTSVQLFQNGKSLEGIDNLGRTWTGTLSNFTLYGVIPAGADQQQQQPQQPGQIPGQQPQQQPQQPESYHADVFLTTQTRRGTITITGVIDSNIDLALPTADPTQQAVSQQTTVISAHVVDETGRAGLLDLYNTVFQMQPTTTP
jgi:hypothetical protein